MKAVVTVTSLARSRARRVETSGYITIFGVAHASAVRVCVVHICPQIFLHE